MLLSLVIPCYNEELNIELMLSETKKVFDPENIEYELVFVNDGSSDNTAFLLKKIVMTTKNPGIQVLDFSRNFGKEAAILAGLTASKGDYVTVIDADLQQRPEVALKMLNYLRENPEYDCVAAYQEDRNEGKVLSSFKKMFYKMINKMSDTNFVNGASDFRTMKRKMVDAVLSMTEYHRFSKGIFSWVGFNTFYMPYNAEERANGESKWSFIKLFRYAVEGIVAFSTFPLKIASGIGIITCIAAFCYAVVVIIQKLAFSIDIPGYATLLVLLLFFSGIQLFALGMLGEYISRIYIQVKKRPVFILREELSNENDKENSSD